MIKRFVLCLSFASLSLFAGSPFTAVRADDEKYGEASIAWRFSSSLALTARGQIQLCYAESGRPERVLGAMPALLPILTQKVPDLRVLLTRSELESRKVVAVVFGYGFRTGSFVCDIPELAEPALHALMISGTPKADEKGEITLLGFHESRATAAVASERLKGRLFIRYVAGPGETAEPAASPNAAPPHR